MKNEKGETGANRRREAKKKIGGEFMKQVALGLLGSLILLLSVAVKPSNVEAYPAGSVTGTATESKIAYSITKSGVKNDTDGHPFTYDVTIFRDFADQWIWTVKGSYFGMVIDYNSDVFTYNQATLPVGVTTPSLNFTVVDVTASGGLDGSGFMHINANSTDATLNYLFIGFDGSHASSEAPEIPAGAVAPLTLLLGIGIFYFRRIQIRSSHRSRR